MLVHDGTAQDYDGSIDDYIAFVLAGDAKAAAKSEKRNKKEARRLAAAAREKGATLRKRAKESEASSPGWPACEAPSSARCSIPPAADAACPASPWAI